MLSLKCVIHNTMVDSSSHASLVFKFIEHLNEREIKKQYISNHINHEHEKIKQSSSHVMCTIACVVYNDSLSNVTQSTALLFQVIQCSGGKGFRTFDTTYQIANRQLMLTK